MLNLANLNLTLLCLCIAQITTTTGQYGFLGKEYLLVKQRTEFDAAASDCRGKNSALVQIESSQENEFIFKEIVKRNRQPIWLGAANFPGTARFKWLDGSRMFYSNWMEGYPNENTDHRNTIVMAHETGKWYDWPAETFWWQTPDSRKSGYLCEWQQRVETFHSDNKTYTMIRELRSFNDAIAVCRERGQRLVQIESREENDFIHSSVQGKDCNIWIGAIRTGNTGTFNWLDGSSLNYSNWYPGLGPLGGRRKKLYDSVLNAVLMGEQNGKWYRSRRDWNTRNCFVCEPVNE